jgi:putative ABC transport system permease protein
LFQLAADAKRYDFLIASVNSENFDQSITSIEKTWKTLVNDTPFEYSFLDQNIQKQYDEDRKVSSIIMSFTFIAMFISCLGLYGLSTYMAERRFKEIGVRKVMGASVNQIVGLMSKEFVKLVVVAFLISVPLAWFVMDKWLQGFAYRISIDAVIFVLAGAAALTIALLTVSFESVKAASTNPVKSLRNE